MWVQFVLGAAFVVDGGQHPLDEVVRWDGH